MKAILSEADGRITEVGVSVDLCSAIEAYSGFAKDAVAQRFQEQDTPFVKFATFGDVLREMSRWP